MVGEGEWAAAKHGKGGKRGCRKLHLGVARSAAIVAQAVTDSTGDDATTGVPLLEQVNGVIGSVTADAAYDTLAFYEAAGTRGARVIVPPTKTAAGRQTEALLGCNILNRMATLGRPASYSVGR